MPLELRTLVIEEDFRNPGLGRHVARMEFEGAVNEVALDLTLVVTVPKLAAARDEDDESGEAFI